jgi:hypothetical protein
VASREVVDKGLEKDALGFVSSVVTGVASTGSTAHMLLRLSERPVLVVRAA